MMPLGLALAVAWSAALSAPGDVPAAARSVSTNPSPRLAAPNAEAGVADALWKEALQAMAARQYRTALDRFEEFGRRYRSEPRVLEAAVRAAVCSCRLERNVPVAVSFLERTSKMEAMQDRRGPVLLLSLEQLAEHYRATKRPTELSKTLSDLARFFPGDGVTLTQHVVSAQACFEAGDWTGAEALFTRVEAGLAPADRESLDLARILGKIGTGGVPDLLKAANERLAANAPAVAERLYAEAARRAGSRPEKAEALTKQGWCLYLRQDYDKAEKLWQEVIRESPKTDAWTGQSRWNLIVLRAGPNNRVKDAIALCEEQARDFKGEFFEEQALFTKAWLHWALRQWPEAKAGFEAYLKVCPGKADYPPIVKYLQDCEKGLAGGKV
jgi:tetratricopeptide (TPR) repeat protein